MVIVKRFPVSRNRQDELQPRGLVSSTATDLEDEEEDVNNVNIERERSVDVLLWADGRLPISNKKLGVVY